MTEPKYDIAISFLSTDEPFAAAMANRLSEGLSVFFFPRSQEDLAGKNGLEAMRAPFLPEGSRIVVVLYREPWGETPWTRVESTATQEGCLAKGWDRLFFLMLDKTSARPNWLPSIRVRFNYPDFGFEQAVGAIKVRVQDAGGTIADLTAFQHAELSRRETEYVKERDQLRSMFGRGAAEKAAAELLGELKRVCAEIDAGGNLSIEFASDRRQCHLRNRVSMGVALDTSEAPKLFVREFDMRLAMGTERLAYFEGQPQLVRQTIFVIDINRARDVGWSAEGNQDKFLSSTALADEIATMFVDLVAKAERGQL